jgi:hypothetical protein
MGRLSSVARNCLAKVLRDWLEGYASKGKLGGRGLTLRS